MTCSILFASDTITTQSKVQLDALYESGQVTKRPYRLFSKQLEHRKTIGLQSRIDSMRIWNLDILYLEEGYHPGSLKHIVREYYFSSEKEPLLQVYHPDRYYENGELSKTYFFDHPEGKETLTSIRSHMASRCILDTIKPIFKVEIEHAGCGMSARYVGHKREYLEKLYEKPLKPKYYLIESLLDPDGLMVSFQIPVKRKFQVIVEGHPF